jgi:hypothetical protein
VLNLLFTSGPGQIQHDFRHDDFHLHRASLCYARQRRHFLFGLPTCEKKGKSPGQFDSVHRSSVRTHPLPSQSSDDHNDKANPVSPVRQPTFWERLFYTAAPVFTLLVIGMILCETIGAWYHLFQSTKRGHDGTVGLFDMLLIHGAWAGGILLFHKVRINH